ncbi:ABC transporter permease [Microbacterium aquimaris]|uniref:ABC transporter permease n=1 Tax=Microbacterium aquimaris TaxID=459816 RepID=A0ABU5N483_9MICO|nr:ABC transporter permease [Microbacterium aquimaris]MDZ8160910.1 ABC transporter permease [Microbacterium aquimaris]
MATQFTVSAGSGQGARWKRIVPPLAFFALIIALWYAISYLVLEPGKQFLLPPPHEVIIDGFFVPETRSDILSAAWESFKVATVGLAIAFVLGVGQAILMSQAKWIENMLYPYAVFLQTIPTLAIIPVIGFWFGFDFGARVVVCVIIALFPLIINPLKGLLGADPGLHDLFTLRHAGRMTRLMRLQLPAALPDIFTGLQTAAGLAVVGAVVGDYFFGRGAIGLGLLIARYSSRLEAAEMLATVLAACGLGVLMFWFFGMLGRRIVGRWSEAWSR